MPYITKTTLNKLVSEIDLQKEPLPKKSRLEGKNLDILSKKERQRLAAITEILGTESIQIDRFFIKLKKPKDSYLYIHPEKTPSYHSNKDCTALTKEYENYSIPSELREQGIESINKFRDFFNANTDLYKSDNIEFFIKVKKIFNLKRPLMQDDMKEIKAPNSGRGSIQDFDLGKIEDELDEFIKQAENYKNQSNKHRYAINLHGNYFQKENISEEEKIILEEWKICKRNIKSKYIVFTMLKNNPEINLHGNFLESLGLNKCALCHSKYESEIYEFI